MTDDPFQPALDRIWDGIDARLAAATTRDDDDTHGWGTGDTPSPSAPDDRLVARFKAAWCTRPLHELEQNKGLRHWARYQPLELALLAIDTVVEQMELTDGARPEAVRDLLAGTASLQVPDDTPDVYREVADAVLAALLEPLEVVVGRSGPESAYERRTWSERLLEEIQTEDGRFQLRASHAAVNVLVGALDLDDIESAMAAAEAALDSLVRRGRLGAAERRARDAQKLSKTYAEDIRRLVAMTQRSYTSVSWDAELRPRLEAAYAHLAERVEAEAAMATRLEEMSDEVEDRARLASILDVVHGCLRRHRELHTAVMRAQTALLHEQEIQAFRPIAALRLVDLTGEVLEPLLDTPTGQATEILTGAFGAFATARAPRVLGFGTLLARLLGPERDRRGPAGQAIQDDVFVEDDFAMRFDLAARRAALNHLATVDQPMLLSQLVDGIEDPEVVRFLALMAACAIDPELTAGALVGTPADGIVATAALSGDDVILQRLQGRSE